MTYLSGTEASKLMDSAKLACKNSFAPYSHFPVGAAVLTTTGRIFTGTNVENASFGLTICAERVAIANAVASGSQNIRAIALYAPVDTITSCGACRQFIMEFGEEVVVVFIYQNAIIQRLIKDLLPYSFSLHSTHTHKAIP